MFEVIIKGSRLESDNEDDYYCSDDYADLALAREAFETIARGDAPTDWAQWPRGYYAGAWVILVGVDVLFEQRMPRDGAELDDGGRSERAMQAGMLGGVDAYNDELES
jgi:hypothetical protein